MNIEVKEFPGWVCGKCGETGESRGSYPHVCPGCGETHTVYSFSGPTRKHPWFSQRTGQYGYRMSGEPSQDWLVDFHNIEEGLRRGYAVDADYEFDTEGMAVLEVAEKLAEIINGYLYTKMKEEIPPVVEWLRKHSEEHERMEAEYQVELCQWNLWTAVHNLRGAEAELEEIAERDALSV